VWTADSPRMLYELLSLYESIGLHDAAETYLGERPAISLRKCTLRCVPPDLDAAAWHQDGAFLGSQVRSLNVWLALSECGGDTPAPRVRPPSPGGCARDRYRRLGPPAGG
jgi:hypothetical protein